MQDSEYKDGFRQRALRDLQARGFLVYAIPDTGQQLGDAGYPDITAVRFGKVVWIMCKKEHEDMSMTDAQRKWRDELYDRHSDAPTFVVTFPFTWQEDLEDIVEGTAIN